MIHGGPQPDLATMVASGTVLTILNTTAQAKLLTNGDTYWFVVVPKFTSTGNLRSPAPIPPSYRRCRRLRPCKLPPDGRRRNTQAGPIFLGPGFCYLCHN